MRRGRQERPVRPKSHPATNAIARFQHGDLEAVSHKLVSRRQPSRTGTNDENLVGDGLG